MDIASLAGALLGYAFAAMVIAVVAGALLKGRRRTSWSIAALLLLFIATASKGAVEARVGGYIIMLVCVACAIFNTPLPRYSK